MRSARGGGRSELRNYGEKKTKLFRRATYACDLTWEDFCAAFVAGSVFNGGYQREQLPAAAAGNVVVESGECEPETIKSWAVKSKIMSRKMLQSLLLHCG